MAISGLFPAIIEKYPVPETVFHRLDLLPFVYQWSIAVLLIFVCLVFLVGVIRAPRSVWKSVPLLAYILVNCAMLLVADSARLVLVETASICLLLTLWLAYRQQRHRTQACPPAPCAQPAPEDSTDPQDRPEPMP